MMDEKKLAGEKACDFIKEGTVIGLGTGSTVYYTIQKLGSLVKAGFAVKAVTTSRETTEICRTLNIPLVSLEEINEIALTIDGADYVDSAFNGIKGGHGALLLEKIVASYSQMNIWVIDSTKMVHDLINAVLPLEICPVGYKQLLAKLHKMGFVARLRTKNNEPLITDLNNYIVDVSLTGLSEPDRLDSELKQITGIFETGFFLNIVDMLIIGMGEKTEILRRPPGRRPAATEFSV